MDNKINFNDILKVCTEFIETSGKNIDAFLEIQQKLVIRTYLGIDEKAVCLTKILLDSDKDIDIPSQFFVIAFEIAILFDCILAYTNIDYSIIPDEQKTYENYDILYKSGLADYILGFCQKDVDRVIRMADRSLAYENLLNLIESLSNFDSEAVNQLTKEYKDFKENTDPELIHDMAKILTYNDQAFGELADKINNESLEKAFDKK